MHAEYKGGQERAEGAMRGGGGRGADVDDQQKEASTAMRVSTEERVQIRDICQCQIARSLRIFHDGPFCEQNIVLEI